MVSEQAFLTAWNNQKLVRGVLKTLHVRSDYANYEDLLQEGILLYAQLLDEPAPLSSAKCNQYYFRKLIWRTLDLLRREKTQPAPCWELVDYAAPAESINDWLNYEILQKELLQMTIIEQCYFFVILSTANP